MLQTVKALTGYTLGSLDGELGTVKEFYFDDQYWVIRYLVANSGSWLTGRHVLISPHALRSADEKEKIINVSLSRKQIEDSPSLESDKPVSRQFEEEFYGYYGWPAYWAGPFMWGAYPQIIKEPLKSRESTYADSGRDPHLRSTHEVTGYHIQATDGEIGHIDDFIIDDQTWAIRYLIVDTRNWWPGKKVLISPQWIERVSWGETKVFTGLSLKQIRNAPEYVGITELSRDYETRLHAHYETKGYWDDQSADKQ